MSYEVARLYTGMCGSEGIDIHKVIRASYELDIGMCDELYFLCKDVLRDNESGLCDEYLDSIKAMRCG